MESDMTYRGRVQGGVVVLEDAKSLAEGTEVQVEPVTAAEPSSWAEVLKEVIGAADGLPPDSSRNHDHYLYGSEKK
jgi:hypothetical protein